MATKISSRKAKGRKLQDFTRDIFRDIFRYKLEKEDIESRQMGGAGVDVILTPASKKLIPFDIECKNQERFNLNEAMKQAVANTQKDRIPIVVFSKNQDDVYVSLKFIDFVELMYPDWEKGVKVNKKSVIPLVDVEKIEQTVDISMKLEK
jgi:hypothetical protein